MPGRATGLILFPSCGAVKNNNALVLAMFGTSEEEALHGLLNIRDRAVRHFPGVPVRIAFTSPHIRRTWRQRHDDDRYRRDHQAVPADILTVQGLLAAVANLQDVGCTSVVVSTWP